MLRDGGLSWHGALAGGFVSFFLFCRQKKLDLAEFLDLCLPGVALGMAVGRLGCFLNGCCVGSETHAPWGVVFREAGFLTPRHPTQLYEVVLNLVIVGVLCAWEKRRRVAGEITLLYFITWSAARFLVEIFRLSPPRILGLSIAQYASIVIFVLSLWWFRRARMTGAVTPWSKGGEEASPRRE